MKEVRVALIGYGGIGHAHANGYAILEKQEAPVRLVAALDIDPKRFSGTVEINTGTGAAGLPSGARAYTSLDALLANEEFDMVDICLPTYLHKEYAIRFLKMGKHVLSEKPMATDLESAERAVRYAELTELVSEKGTPAKVESAIHKTIKKVTSDLEEMKFNTAIAAMMGLLNDIYDGGSLAKSDLELLVRLLCPIAPHLCEEMWEELGGKGFCSLAAWPAYDEAKTVDSEIELPVQINGKVRGKITVAADASKDDILAAAKAQVAAQLEGKTIIKEIVVPGKLISLVVK